jgi:hypothetical protein
MLTIEKSKCYKITQKIFTTLAIIAMAKIFSEKLENYSNL